MARKKYTSEFREQAVRLVTIENMKHAKVAADLGISPHTLVSWVSQARALKGTFTPTAGRDIEASLRAVEAELRQVKIERDILKKATAYFAKEHA